MDEFLHWMRMTHRISSPREYDGWSIQMRIGYMMEYLIRRGYNMGGIFGSWKTCSENSISRVHDTLAEWLEFPYSKGAE